MDPDNFITEVRQEFPSEAIMKQQFGRINTNINFLDGNLTQLIKRHENDFFAAFKSHLFHINTQLQDLKDRHETNLQQVQQDEFVIGLQKSMEWFRDEAVSLGNSYRTYKRNCERWKAKAKSLEEDHRFLESQVKNARKQNRKLVAQLGGFKASSRKAEDTTFLTEAFLSRSFKTPKRPSMPQTKAGKFLAQLCERVPVRSPEFISEVETYLASQEAEFKQTIAELRNTVQQEKLKIKAENAAQSSLLIEKTDLEELFLDSIEEVSRAVARSRNKEFIQSRFGNRSSIEASNGEAHRVLELLVSDEPSLILLYERLFPYRALHRHAKTTSTSHHDPEIPPDVKELLTLVDIAAHSRSAIPRQTRLTRSQKVRFGSEFVK